jgi:glycine/D-amino acid oxidase-like deaminating enzyme
LRREYETIIIGGGVIGSGIAYHLSEVQDDGILVIERNFPLCGTSGSTQAWVWVHSKTPSWYGEFSMYSSELYGYLHRKIGDIEFNRTGGLSPFFTEAEREHARRLAESQAQVGIKIEVLHRDQVLTREPALSPNVLGATYSAIDGNVNPMRLVEQYMRAAKKNGVTYEYYNPVTSIEKKQGSFIVTTQRGTFTCKKLVLSAGVWMNEIGKMLGLDIPIRPVRGQVIITEPLAPLLKHTMSGLRQSSNGEVLIGYSKEEAGFDRSTTLDVLGETAKFGIKLVPDLAKAKIVRSFSGLRVMPKDEYPIIGPVPGIENLYVTAMHSGVTLSPLIGTIMTELLTEGETSIPIDQFSIARFA